MEGGGWVGIACSIWRGWASLQYIGGWASLQNIGGWASMQDRGYIVSKAYNIYNFT